MEWGLKTCGMGTIMGSLVKREVIPSMDQFVYPPCPTAALPKGIAASPAALEVLQRRGVERERSLGSALCFGVICAR